MSIAGPFYTHYGTTKRRARKHVDNENPGLKDRNPEEFERKVRERETDINRQSWGNINTAQ